MSTLRILPDVPTEVVVHDQVSRCPYLPARDARMPLRLPIRSLSHDELDARLAAGDRRQGYFLYRTRCPTCVACEPIRIDVRRFAPSRSQRRAWTRGRRHLRVEMGPPVADQRRVDLYNAHRRQRGLDDDSDPIDLEGYRAFLVHTCCDTVELKYFVGPELIGVAIMDRGATSLSAVYCYYEPAYEHLSPGTYSILEQVNHARATGRRYLYLGLHVAESHAMRYKARYLPHERLVAGEWQSFQRG